MDVDQYDPEGTKITNDAEGAKAHITWYELDGPRNADARGTEKVFSNNPVAEQLQTIQEKLPVFLHTLPNLNHLIHLSKEEKYQY